LTKAFLLTPRDTDVSWSLRNPEAGRLADDQSKFREKRMKVRLAALLTFAIGFAFPTFAQEQNTVDPEVRQQIEAAHTKFVEAFNKHDSAAVADLFTFDAVQMPDWGEGGTFSGQQAIEKLYALDFASSPPIGRKAYSGVCNRRQDIRYLGVEFRAMEGLRRKDLCS
jgi:hypothetical protein